MAEEERGWLGRAWDSVTDFAGDVKEAAVVVMNDPGHAAAVFIDGFEHGVTDVVGVVVGGVADVAKYGVEKTTGYSMYEGSLMDEVSNGLMWAVDGAESLVGIEKPVLRGDGDELLFGAGRVTGQVTAVTLAVAYPGAIISGTQSAVSGAWSVATTGAKVASYAGTALSATTVAVPTLIAADLALNEGKVTFPVAKWAGEKGMEYMGIDDPFQHVPEGVKDAFEDFMQFMGDNPQLAKWGSFALALLCSAPLVSWALGSRDIGGVLSLAIGGVAAWGLSDMFAKSAAGYAGVQNEPATEPVRALPAMAAPAPVMA